MKKTSLDLNEPGKHIQQNIQEHTEVVDSSNTQGSPAISAMRDNKVHLSTAAQSFVVEGTRGNKYAVTLHLKESCQCEALGTCWHSIAANLSIGIDDSSEKRVYNLTQLRRNQREKPNKKAGKKQPRPCDEETIINAAPDSTIKSRPDFIDLTDIPVCSNPPPPICNEAAKVRSMRYKTSEKIEI